MRLRITVFLHWTGQCLKGMSRGVDGAEPNGRGFEERSLLVKLDLPPRDKAQR